MTIYRYEDAISDEAHQKAHELGEFHMFVPSGAVSDRVVSGMHVAQTVQFRGHPAVLATLDDDLTGVPEGFVQVDTCPYF